MKGTIKSTYDDIRSKRFNSPTGAITGEDGVTYYFKVADAPSVSQNDEVTFTPETKTFKMATDVKLV
jgi:hypothetical protein